MNSPPRKARKITQATLAFQLTPKYLKTPETGSPELATRYKGCTSPSSSTSNPSALASTPIPSTEADDDDDDEEEIDTRGSVLASTRCTFTVPLHRPELSGYRRCFRSNRRLGGNKISWIYLHGVELEKRGPSGKWIKHWICRYCHEQGRIKVMNAQASTNCTRHLHDQHGIGLERLEESVQAQGRIEGFMDEHLWEERWREDYVNWIAKDDITLSQATSPHLQRLLARSGPKVANLLPQRSSARRWLMDAYEQRKPEVAESLRTSLSDVSLSFDGWSSPNGLSLLGVVAHWIDKDCTLRNALIGMPRMEGQHSGQKIAKAVSALIRDYGIQRKIGAFVLDNAANNDVAVGFLAQEFGLDPAQCRLRCWGHTVNLVVKALLFGEGLSAFQKELSDAGDDESFDIWRRQHAIGKLHNIVRYIMRSDQRIQAFNEAQRDIADDITTFCYRLVKDTGIRWNSVYNMITRALLLENPIRSYCRQWRRQDTKAYDLSQDFLFEGDWEELRHYEELLLPFKLATERLEGKGNKLSLEGSHGALWEVLPAFDFLFMMLKIRADDVSKNPDLFVDHYRHCINHGFEKLKDYYGKSDRTRLYRAAIALHPCYRNDYFANAWAKVPRSRLEIRNAQNAVSTCYSEFLSTLRKSEDCSTSSHSEPTTDTTIKGTDDIYAQFDNFFNTVRRNATISAERYKKKRKREDSELDRFLELSLEDLNVTDLYKNQPIAWWRDFGQRMFPTLAKLAFKLFAIPGMSAESERAFSQAKRMVTDERFSLKQDAIEAEQCLKSWLINKVTDGQKAWGTLQQVQMEVARESATTSKDLPGRVDADVVSAPSPGECLVPIS